MASDDRDNLPTLSDMNPRSTGENVDPRSLELASRTRSSSISIPMSSESYENETNLFHNVPYGDLKGWARKFISFLCSCIPGVMNPLSKLVLQWNKLLGFSCLVAIFMDPMFFLLLTMNLVNKCLVINWPMTTTIVVFRSLTDFIYLLNILLQFRLAYVNPESGVVGAWVLVDHPKKIALNYLFRYFCVDLLILLPLPQIMVLWVLPHIVGGTRANLAKDILRAAVLLQYFLRIYWFIPLLVRHSPAGFIFETARGNFVKNLVTILLSGHAIGVSWYFLGLKRVDHCLRDACRASDMHPTCMEFINCGNGNDLRGFQLSDGWSGWINDTNAAACFTVSSDGFDYGMYKQAVSLTTIDSIITRYLYSLFWGLQQISTMAGNQTPAYFIPEILFTIAIIGLGFLFFAFIVGNMQNFLQSLGQRRLEMSVRSRDVEQWMKHWRLPLELRRKVFQAEIYNWAAKRGVNEEMLLENLPEDLQKDIRRHLFTFVKKIRIFEVMDEPILDAICERFKQKLYIQGSQLLYPGGLIEKMFFIVRGKLESIGEDGIEVTLMEGDVCGEELLSWCLEHSSVNSDSNKIRIPGHRLLSNRMVRCLENVEAFSLRAADLEEVTSRYARFLPNARVQGAIRYISPYWRCLAAATTIQVAWRYRKKRLSRANTSQSKSSSKHGQL